CWSGPRLSSSAPTTASRATRASVQRALSRDAAGIDLDHRPMEHDPSRGHVGERRRLRRVREVLAPDARELAVVAFRLSEVNAHMVAVRPVGLVRLQLLAEDLHREARLLL